MAVTQWEEAKVIYCERAHERAALELEVIYPSEPIPDWPRRVIGHRCSLAAKCEVQGFGNCYWTGANPLNDPFGVIK
jgi:hypothetical protein